MRRRAMTRRSVTWCLAGFVAALAAGCSRMDGRIPVTGRVTLDGAPLVGVLVRFHASPDTYGNGGYAVADASGRFTATTLQGRPGIFPGKYAITLQYHEAFMDPKNPPAQREIPAAYAGPDSTPFKVTAAKPKLDIDLQVNSSKR